MSNEQCVFEASALFETFAKSATEMILMINFHHDTSSHGGVGMYEHKIIGLFKVKTADPVRVTQTHIFSCVVHTSSTHMCWLTNMWIVFLHVLIKSHSFVPCFVLTYLIRSLPGGLLCGRMAQQSPLTLGWSFGRGLGLVALWRDSVVVGRPSPPGNPR